MDILKNSPLVHDRDRNYHISERSSDPFAKLFSKPGGILMLNSSVDRSLWMELQVSLGAFSFMFLFYLRTSRVLLRSIFECSHSLFQGYVPRRLVGCRVRGLIGRHNREGSNLYSSD